MLRYTLPGSKADPAGFHTDASGALEQISGLAQLRQSLLLLLSTRPGERVELPEFGCPLDRLVHEPNDATTAGIAIRLITNSISRFEPRAAVVALDARPDPDDQGTLLIDLTYRDRESDAHDQIRLPVGLGLD